MKTAPFYYTGAVGTSNGSSAAHTLQRTNVAEDGISLWYMGLVSKRPLLNWAIRGTEKYPSSFDGKRSRWPYKQGPEQKSVVATNDGISGHGRARQPQRKVVLSRWRMLFQISQWPDEGSFSLVQIPLLLRWPACFDKGIVVFVGWKLTPSVSKNYHLILVRCLWDKSRRNQIWSVRQMCSLQGRSSRLLLMVPTLDGRNDYEGLGVDWVLSCLFTARIKYSLSSCIIDHSLYETRKAPLLLQRLRSG